MTKEYKPCTICNSDVVFVKRIDSDEEVKYDVVRCIGCNARIVRRSPECE